MFEKAIQGMLYSKATKPEELPWHSEKPAKFLVDAVAQRKAPAKALDLGCGTGVFAVYLAKQGYDVTAIDFIPKAFEMAKARGQAENVNVNWHLTDLFEWQTNDQFDLVLDSGCSHNFPARLLRRYKERLLSWTKPGSDFILAAFGKRHFLDWRPIGPKRRTRQTLAGLFASEFREEAYEQEIMRGIPLPIGPTVMGQCFWFKRQA